MREYLKSQERRFVARRVAGCREDDGQVSILVVLAVGFFLLLFVGFGVDMTNLFFHRQMAQNAADAACVAAGEDILVEVTQGPKACLDAKNNPYVCGNLTGAYAPVAWPTKVDCTGSTNIAPCQYAALDGYSSTNSLPLAAGTVGNNVSLSFPPYPPAAGSIPGIVPPNPKVGGPFPFVEADVTDSVKVYFSSLLSGNSTQTVHALAKCGLQQAQAPVPILILDPTDPTTFDIKGNPTVDLVGGPSKSIQVNSNNPNAIQFPWGNAQVDLSQGGPDFSGSNLGLFGGSSTPPCASPCKNWSDGSTGGWVSPANPINDPFTKTLPPKDLGIAGTTKTVPYPQDGCPDSVNGSCTEYFAGDYPGGISFGKGTHILNPGVYFIKGGSLTLGPLSIIRPSTAAGDGSMGVTFYLTCSTPGNCKAGSEASVSVDANSGKPTVDAFVPASWTCPNAPALDPKLGVPASLGGNVFLGPCTSDGTYVGPDNNAVLGPDRGILFWQDRSAPNATTFHGGAGLLLEGTMYFHDCGVAGGLGTGCSLPPTGYQTSLEMWGGTGSGTRLIGEIVTDQLYMRGTSTITMDINPFPVLNILKVALLQ